MTNLIKKLFLFGLVAFFSVFLLVPNVLATEKSGSLSTGVDTGIGINTNNCNPLTVSNGSVSAYPSCTITCNSGYSLSGSSCVKNASSSGSSSGGGGSYESKCSSVVYSNWDNFCTGSYQYRSVVSKTPSDCSLSTSQQIATYRTCQITTPTTTPVITPTTTPTTTSSTDLSGTSLSEQVLAREKDRLAIVDNNLAKRLSGRILLQVEEKGEAWYINPLDLKRYYLGRPADAFNLMRSLGLGVKHSVITAGPIPIRLYGRILIDVEDYGKAYWINPVDGGRNYLGRPADAFRILRDNGLGISNANINKIALGYL